MPFSIATPPAYDSASQAAGVSSLFWRVYRFGCIVSTLRCGFVNDSALIGVCIGGDGAAFVAAVHVGFKLVQVAVPQGALSAPHTSASDPRLRWAEHGPPSCPGCSAVFLCFSSLQSTETDCFASGQSARGPRTGGASRAGRPLHLPPAAWRVAWRVLRQPVQAALAGIKACADLPGATPLCLQVSARAHCTGQPPLAPTPGQLMEWGSCPSFW